MAGYLQAKDQWESSFQKAWAHGFLPYLLSPASLTCLEDVCVCHSFPPSAIAPQTTCPLPPSQPCVVFGVREPSFVCCPDYFWPALECGFFESLGLGKGWGEENGGMREKNEVAELHRKQNNTLKCNSTICRIELESFTLILNNWNSIILAI